MMGEKHKSLKKNGYLGIRFIKRAGNFWNGGLLKKTEFVLSNEFWQHCRLLVPRITLPLKFELNSLRSLLKINSTQPLFYKSLVKVRKEENKLRNF